LVGSHAGRKLRDDDVSELLEDPVLPDLVEPEGLDDGLVGDADGLAVLADRALPLELREDLGEAGHQPSLIGLQKRSGTSSPQMYLQAR